jgi:hypothetical protein
LKEMKEKSKKEGRERQRQSGAEVSLFYRTFS